MNPDIIELSIVLPAHNEALALSELLPELRATLASLNATYEVIVVNDGSSDETPLFLSRQAEGWPQLRVLNHSVNRGQSEALATGIRASAGSIVVVMDSDGQSVPADISEMVARLRQSPGLMMVVGRRVERKDSLLKTMPSLIANGLISLLSGTTITDTGCGIKAIRGNLIRAIHFGPETHRFLPVILAMDGAFYEVMNVHHKPRIHGKTHYGLERTGGVLLDILALRFTARRARPYHTLGYMGLLFIGGAILLNIYVLVEKFNQGIWVHRNPLFLIAIVLFMTGLQILVLGLVCEIMAVMLSRRTKEDDHARQG